MLLSLAYFWYVCTFKYHCIMFNMLTELIFQGTIPRLLEGKMLVSTVLWFFAILFCSLLENSFSTYFPSHIFFFNCTCFLLIVLYQMYKCRLCITEVSKVFFKIRQVTKVAITKGDLWCKVLLETSLKGFLLTYSSGSWCGKKWCSCYCTFCLIAPTLCVALYTHLDFYNHAKKICREFSRYSQNSKTTQGTTGTSVAIKNCSFL